MGPPLTRRGVHPFESPSPSSSPSNENAPEQLLPYLRDVHDVLALVNEEVAAQHDLLTTVLEANIAVISVEQTKISVLQNSTIEQLTKLSTPRRTRHQELTRNEEKWWQLM